ncbi:uncharacterized protein LOC100644647 isoform X2 [Bombus terrestris]|nr:uncharacterized protein LOC100644647 isoform X2 [Bombus terrestris]
MQYVTASYAAKLISMRTNNGLYKSLDDILLRTEIDVDSWNNFCTSYINHYKKQKWTKLIKSDINITSMPATILGIYVGPTAITWTLVDCHCNVLLWDSIIWQNNSVKYNIINSVPLFVEQLPLSSAYVIEESKFNKKLRYFSTVLQHQITSSIASCIKLMINQRTNNSNSSETILYILKSSATAHVFNLLIATEMITVDYVMKRILDDTKKDDELLWDIHIPYELKQKYMKKSANEREQMGRSLLTSVACLHIVRSCIS